MFQRISQAVWRSIQRYVKIKKKQEAQACWYHSSSFDIKIFIDFFCNVERMATITENDSSEAELFYIFDRTETSITISALTKLIKNKTCSSIYLQYVSRVSTPTVEKENYASWCVSIKIINFTSIFTRLSQSSSALSP